MKCTFCAAEINDPPYNDDGDHYHTNCHFLISRILSYDKKTLHKLSLLIKEACAKSEGPTSEVNCC